MTLEQAKEHAVKKYGKNNQQLFILAVEDQLIDPKTQRPIPNWNVLAFTRGQASVTGFSSGLGCLGLLIPKRGEIADTLIATSGACAFEDIAAICNSEQNEGRAVVLNNPDAPISVEVEPTAPVEQAAPVEQKKK